MLASLVFRARSGARTMSKSAQSVSESIHGKIEPRSKAMQRAMRREADSTTALSRVSSAESPPALPSEPPMSLPPPPSFGNVMASNMVMGFAMSVRMVVCAVPFLGLLRRACAAPAHAARPTPRRPTPPRPARCSSPSWPFSASCGPWASTRLRRRAPWGATRGRRPGPLLVTRRAALRRPGARAHTPRRARRGRADRARRRLTRRRAATLA
jgi:hypothetical protein